MQFHDRLKFTTTGTSAASLSDGTAVAGCRNIAKVISDTVGQVTALTTTTQNIPFTIEDGTGKWEDSLFNVGGTSGAPTLTRTQVLASSAGGTTAETFSVATLTVFNTVPGKILSRVAIDSDPAFSTSVPLVQPGKAWMPQQTISGALTFTPAANAVKGAYASVNLISDGVNVPTFSGGFREAIGSAGYDNRAAGIVNVLEFEYDGYYYWYAVNQASNALPPTVSSSSVANATSSTLNIVTSGNLDTAYTPASSAFTVVGHTVLSATVTSTNINLSVSPAFASGEAARNVSYVQPATNGVRDIYGNLMVSFSGISITNNVTATASAVTLSLSSSSTAIGTAVTVTVGTDNPLTGSQTESVTLTAPVAGAWSTNPVSLSSTTTSATTTFTPSAAGSGNITASASGTPTLTGGSVAYTATAAATETLSIDNIATPQTVNSPFTVTGTWINAQPGNLDYRLSDDSAGVWTQVAATINSNGTWSFSQTPSSTSAGRTISVRDRGNQSVTATSNTYVVNAAAAGSYPQFTSFSSSDSQSGTGPYTITGSGVGTGTGGVNDIATEKGGLSALAATGDFTFDFKVLAAGAEVGLGLRLVQSTNTMSNLTGAYWLAGGSGAVPASLRRSGGSTVTFTPAGADVYRYSRVGSTTTMSVQRNGTGSFTVVDTLTGITTAKVWVDFICCGTTSAQLLTGTGFA